MNDTDIMERIEALAVELATDISDKIITDLHGWGIYDMIGEQEFRRTALHTARQTIIDRLNVSASSPPTTDTLAGR